MPRKTNTDRSKRGSRNGNGGTMERRTPRPQPKVDFTIDQLDYRNVTLLRRFVTDHGRILLRKYTGLPAAFQRRLTRSV
ncbi:MAG: ribosomal protein S18, partial [Verrucomicrobia bacterium]|nr:ribosomal protein S18 [Verrucomicrobiota bacterium]